MHENRGQNFSIPAILRNRTEEIMRGAHSCVVCLGLKSGLEKAGPTRACQGD